MEFNLRSHQKVGDALWRYKYENGRFDRSVWQCDVQLTTIQRIYWHCVELWNFFFLMTATETGIVVATAEVISERNFRNFLLRCCCCSSIRRCVKKYKSDEEEEDGQCSYERTDTGLNLNCCGTQYIERGGVKESAVSYKTNVISPKSTLKQTVWL